MMSISANQNHQSLQPGRIYFLDHMRWLLVVVMVLMHSMFSYTTSASWWYVVDEQSRIAFDISILFYDVFGMPTFFFVAGYFSIGSLEKYRVRIFLRQKFSRLMIPWLLGVMFVGPMVVYFQHYQSLTLEGAMPEGYLDFWWIYVADGLNLFTGRLPSLEQFTLHHFWFVSLLFFFFATQALAWAGSSKYET